MFRPVKYNLIIILTFICFGLLTFNNVYAFRMGKPIPIQEINKDSLVELNNTLEEIWNVLNGRYNLDVTSTSPTEDATEGDMRTYFTGDIYRVYIFVNGSWRSIDFNDFDLVDASDNNVLDASGNQIIVY